MKNFTFLITVLFFALIANAQPSNQFSEKIERSREHIKLLNISEKIIRSIPQNVSNEKIILKNTNAALKLDSIVSEEYDYDRYSSEVWEYSEVIVFYYNELYQNHKLISKEWDDFDKVWYIYSHAEIEFDSKGNLSQLTFYSADEPGDELIAFNRIVPEFDGNNRLSAISHYGLDEDDESTWELWTRITYEYNSSGQIEFMKEWIAIDDDDDFKSAEEDGDFVEFMRHSYHYSSSGLLESIIRNYIFLSEMMPMGKINYSYNISGQLIEKETLEYDFRIMDFMPFMKSTTSYNSAGDVDVEIEYFWDEDEEDWVEYSKDENIYDTSIPISNTIFPSVLDFFYEQEEYNMVTNMKYAISEVHSYSWIDKEWIHVQRSKFYYSPLGSSLVEEINLQQHSLYPNPTKSSITIEWPNSYSQLQFEIYQSNGVVLYKQIIDQQSSIDIGQLENGVYLYRLKNKNDVIHSGKFIKQ